jgi:hypothetical protein
MTLTMIRNTQSGPTVFVAEDGQHVEWEGAGDPNGLDIQPVPPTFVESVQFQRALTRGIFEIEMADDAVREALEKHRESWQARADMRRDASEQAIEKPQNNDTLMLDCMGPAGRGSTQLCKEPVPIRAAAVDTQPPLCPKHSYLKTQFTPEHTDRMIGGKQEVVWRRVRMGDREKQQS